MDSNDIVTATCIAATTTGASASASISASAAASESASDSGSCSRKQRSSSYGTTGAIVTGDEEVNKKLRRPPSSYIDHNNTHTNTDADTQKVPPTE